MIYLSINYFQNNIYLYQTKLESILCKKNYSYIMNDDHYNKISCIIQNPKVNDSIKIYDDNEMLPITFNCSWSSKSHNIRKNILIPPANLIDKQYNTIDLNSINCLCQDKTRLNQLPTIKLTFQNQIYQIDQWTGYNQVWISNINHENYTVDSYLYFFYTRAILMISIQDKTTNNFIDIMSIYHNDNYIHDEFLRVNCNEYMPKFQDFQILKSSINISEPNITIKTIYNEKLLPN